MKSHPLCTKCFRQKQAILRKLSVTVLLVLTIILNLQNPKTFANTSAEEQEKTSSPSPMFTDVALGSAHYVAIKFLKDRGLLQGYGNNSFRPKNNITRAEALKIVLGTFTKTTTKIYGEMKLQDVSASEWYYDIIKQAVESGIMSGYSDNTFHPNQNITRIESLKIALLQENQPLPVKIGAPPYSDVPIESWFAPYAQVSKERGLLIESRDNSGELLPAQPINRGEFAELIYHLLQSSNLIKFGRATYYADILAGHGTSSGDPYKPGVFTTAHKTLPFGTRLLVKNLANGQEVEVKVNDRGPYATGVELDLSKSAFATIASPGEGIINIQYKILEQDLEDKSPSNQ